MGKVQATENERVREAVNARTRALTKFLLWEFENFLTFAQKQWLELHHYTLSSSLYDSASSYESLKFFFFHAISLWRHKYSHRAMSQWHHFIALYEGQLANFQRCGQGLRMLSGGATCRFLLARSLSLYEVIGFFFALSLVAKTIKLWLLYRFTIRHEPYFYF